LSSIKAIFWDVGGVLATNAWDRGQREEALAHFRLDKEEFADRHELSVSSFERGKINLSEYLERTVFYRARPFTQDEFRNYIFSLSQPKPEVLSFAKSLADSARYLMGTINNESLDLNLYRIEKFGMRAIFKVFISSCFVGYRKPEPEIYKLALEITQQTSEECCFIDDRALNLEVAKRLGMHVIEMDGLEQLKSDLSILGVQP
jgi:putative hydrolase of the HAD superfamily